MASTLPLSGKGRHDSVRNAQKRGTRGRRAGGPAWRRSATAGATGLGCAISRYPTRSLTAEMLSWRRVPRNIVRSWGLRSLSSENLRYSDAPSPCIRSTSRAWRLLSTAADAHMALRCCQVGPVARRYWILVCVRLAEASFPLRGLVRGILRNHGPITQSFTTTDTLL